MGSPDPRAAHDALESWCEGEPPDWRWLLAERGVRARGSIARALGTGTWLAARLRELYDEDWWRNPRAPAFVCAWAHDAEAVNTRDAMKAWVLSVERSVA